MPPNENNFVSILHTRSILASVHRDGGYNYAWQPIRYSRTRHVIQSNVKSYRTAPGDYDCSNGQYGILGIWACAHAGLEVPFNYWRLEGFHWRKAQYTSGAWGYLAPNRQSAPAGPGAFTPAGLASSYICDEFLEARNIGVHAVADPSIVLGQRWLKAHFRPLTHNVYGMYGVERTAFAGGMAAIGSHDWYQDFARTLLADQAANGSWAANFGRNRWWWKNGGRPNIGTAYALLILDRGLNPVFMNKLAYGGFYGQWNARQRDLANVTSWISRTYESSLNWRVVSINSSVSQWLDAPILYIDGYKDPKFTPGQIVKMRTFVNAGGMVFCSCNRGSVRFRTAMTKYGQQVVNHQYEATILPQQSPLYHMLPNFRFQRNPRFLAISNGIRVEWIVSSRDIGSTWQRRAFSRIDDWKLAASLYLYATGQGYLNDRLKSLTVPAPTRPTVRSLAVARIEFNGNWNPEPGAWPRMAKLAATDFQTAMTVTNTPIAQLNAKVTPMALMTGTARFTLSSADIASLKAYIAQGGMIFADSGGGNASFTASFDILAAKLVPGGDLVNLPANSSIYTGRNPGGINAAVAHFRKYYIDHHHVRTTPDMQGVKINGRWVVVFSPWDITSGLLGTNTWGINGYNAASAQALARNIICYAIGH